MTQRKVVAITGANRGLGRAMALEFAKAGYSVLVGSRSEKGGASVATEIVDAGGAAASAVCDVTQYSQVEAMVERAYALWGRLDAMVNNAGVIEPMQRIWEAEPDLWEQSVRTNLVGVFHGCRAAVPRMIAAGGGVVLNVSSGAAHRPLEQWSAYCAGKAGAAMLTRSLALEAGERGLRAYGFQPGVVDTGMQEQIRREYVNEVSALPKEALLDPAIPAKVAVRLCEEAPEDLNGEDLTIRDPSLLRRLGVSDLV